MTMEKYIAVSIEIIETSDGDIPEQFDNAIYIQLIPTDSCIDDEGIDCKAQLLEEKVDAAVGAW